MPKNLDPSRTTMIRRRYMAEMTRRIKVLKKQIRMFLVDQDAFGLAPIPVPGPFKINVAPKVYAFKTDAEKVGIFREWLQGQVDSGILETTGAGKPWNQTYIDSAYRKGITRAYIDTHKEALAPSPDFFAGSKAQFLQQAFAAPETVSKIQLLGTRAFNDLKGFTDQMGADANRILANGIANGNHPDKIAREMSKSIDGLTKKRALVIARTEVIHAHAEGQLDSFEMLGVEELQIRAEWLTAGDDRVCERCAGMEGRIMTVPEARGLIPLHPGCRCAWIPAEAPEKEEKKSKAKTEFVPEPESSVIPDVVSKVAAVAKKKSKPKAAPKPKSEVSAKKKPKPDDVPKDSAAKRTQLVAKADNAFEEARDEADLIEGFTRSFDNRSQMTKAQLEALNSYMELDYTRINGVLRGKFPELKDSKEVQKQIRDLGKAIQKAPALQSDTLVFRGISKLKIDEIAKENGGSLVGAVLTDNAFASVSVAKHTAKSFAGLLDVGHIIEGVLPKGAKYVRGLAGEYELVLPPGVKMEIVGKRLWTDNNGWTYNILEVLFDVA